MQATVYYDQIIESWVLEDGYDTKPSTNGTWLYLNEEMPVKSGMLFKSNQTFFQATVVDNENGTGAAGENFESQGIYEQ